MKTKKPDVYDRAVKYLTRNPNKIPGAWRSASCHPSVRTRGASLFLIAHNGDRHDHGCSCGCLTQIRGNLDQSRPFYSAETESLFKAIGADDRIPTSHFAIERRHLPIFAEWQRRLDRELGRKPPERP
jgi:hypothetical protein